MELHEIDLETGRRLLKNPDIHVIGLNDIYGVEGLEPVPR